MKKMIWAVSTMTVLFVMLEWNAFAFHNEGAASCAGCHTMHNNGNGTPIDPANPNGNSYLLTKETASDVCLTCHASSHGAAWSNDPFVPSPEKGAGNFAFMQLPNINDGPNGHLNPISGSYGVHNINAPSMNSVPDPVLASAPGGTYPSSELGCTSCHDPHGNANFRMLRGAGPVAAGDYVFTNPAPEAEGISLDAATTESPFMHTAYKGGMSAWCANCHGDYHNNASKMIHPSGHILGSTIAQTYNLYNGTGQPAGNPASSYLPTVAFEDPGMTISSTAGPTASSQVSCITCHRAHGSPQPNLGRWDFSVTFLSEDGVESGSPAQSNPYPFASSTQRSLCNKCHATDRESLVSRNLAKHTTTRQLGSRAQK